MTENAYGTTVRPTPTGDGPGTGSDDASVKDKATDAAAAGKQAAGDVAQHAAGQAQQVAQETKQQARDLVGEARSQLTEQASTQHQNLVSNLKSLADELSSMAQNGEQNGTASHLVSQAGDRARTAADWLDSRQPGDLIGELRSFGRRRPGAFLAGAVLAGVVAGRLTRGAVAAHSDDSPSSSSNGLTGSSGAELPSRHSSPETTSVQGTGYATPGTDATYDPSVTGGTYAPDTYAADTYAPGTESTYARPTSDTSYGTPSTYVTPGSEGTSGYGGSVTP